MLAAGSAKLGCFGEHLWEGQLQLSYGFAIFFLHGYYEQHCVCLHPRRYIN